ncbi:MAG: hypothetical protein NTV43_13630 [Methylococcales bacterium]|nr:hypothetical protein [Methylococcales bacterium]
MMPHNPEPSLTFTIKPSRRLNTLLIIAHLLALGASIANALPLAVKIGLFVGIASHGWWLVRRRDNPAYTIKYSGGLAWQLVEGNDSVLIDIVESTVITRVALFLHFRQTGQTVQSWRPVALQTRLILNDALAGDDYRALIVKLKTSATK